MTALAHPGPVFEPRSPALSPIEEHVAALEFHSILAYHLWCHRSGFDSGLEKDGEQRRLEREAARHRSQAPHLTEKRLQMHRRLAAGDADEEVVKDGLFSAYEAYKLLEGDDGAREALLKLFIHVDRYIDVQSTKQVFPKGNHKSMAWGLGQLARHHRRWLRPLEDWRPTRRTADACTAPWPVTCWRATMCRCSWMRRGSSAIPSWRGSSRSGSSSSDRAATSAGRIPRSG